MSVPVYPDLPTPGYAPEDRFRVDAGVMVTFHHLLLPSISFIKFESFIESLETLSDNQSSKIASFQRKVMMSSRINWLYSHVTITLFPAKVNFSPQKSSTEVFLTSI